MNALKQSIARAEAATGLVKSALNELHEAAARMKTPAELAELKSHWRRLVDELAEVIVNADEKSRF